VPYAYPLGAALLMGGPAVLFGLVDMIVGVWRPARTRTWVILGPAAFAVALMVALILPGLFLPGGFRLNPRPLIPLIAAVAAGLVWWSLLPTGRRDVTGVFD
jgi:hypothetical protein